jgi:hypothetical protein
MPEISESAQKAALAIVEHIKKGAPDLDLCLVSHGGDCRDTKGCTDHAVNVLAAIIAQHAEGAWVPVGEGIPPARTPVFVYIEQKSEYSGKIIRCRTIAEYIPSHTVLASDYLDPNGDWEWEDQGWEYSEEHDDYYLPESWYERAWFNSDYSGWFLSANITHWRTLPKPPEGKS